MVTKLSEAKQRLKYAKPALWMVADYEIKDSIISICKEYSEKYISIPESVYRPVKESNMSFTLLKADCLRRLRIKYNGSREYKINCKLPHKYKKRRLRKLEKNKTYYYSQHITI